MGKQKSSYLLIIDCICFIIALLIGTILRFGIREAGSTVLHYYSGFYFIILALSVISYILLYFYYSPKDGYILGKDLISQTWYVLRNHILLFIILILSLFVFQAGALLSRRLIFYTFLISFALDLLAREIIRVLYQNEYEKNTKTLTIAGKIVRILPVGEKQEMENAQDFPAVKHVFAIGCKGIPAEYGGFESFMQNLTGFRQNTNILYHVARMADDNLRFEYHNAIVFDVHVPTIGSAKAVYYDIAALKRCIRYCRINHVPNPVFFIMACRIGPFMGHYHRQIEAIGGRVFLNPDGHEFERSKWSLPVRKYWKYSERLMVRNVDQLICDSKNIEKYIREEYKEYDPKTTYIAYGSSIIHKQDILSDERSLSEFQDWLTYNKVQPKQYFLIIGRFVPENSYEVMIREFMASNTKKDLVIVTTENGRFFDYLEKQLHFTMDSRIKFVGTIYDTSLLNAIRVNAFAYIHGHSVGGTNPSLLESLGSTDINLLLDVGFNHEVGEDGALYWTREKGSLQKLIDEVDQMKEEQSYVYGQKAKARIQSDYLWEKIVEEYEKVFLSEESN